MHLWDVLLPINLGPLTYNCPDALLPAAQPGQRVMVPIKKATATGILLGVSKQSYIDKTKDIICIPDETPLFSIGMLKLIHWLSDYYLATEGLVFKQAVPSEMLNRIKRKASRGRKQAAGIPVPRLTQEDADNVARLITGKGYKTMLLHAPSASYEYAAAELLLEKTRGAILLFPEIISAERFYNSLPLLLRSRACLLSSDMSAGAKSDSFEGIITSKFDIVVGTRTALFAPLRQIGLIIIFHEHSASYKVEDGVRFNVRDAAVMRGYFEKTAVMLTSSSPSLESWHNAKTGKYIYAAINKTMKLPKTRIINMYTAPMLTPYLSKTVAEEAKRQSIRNEKLLFIMNRKGHSTTLNCLECGQVTKCSNCNVPLVLYKDPMKMLCSYCGDSINVPETCSRCGSHSLEFLGAGTQKLQEDIEELLGTESLRIDRDASLRRSHLREISDKVLNDNVCSLIGTKMIAAHFPRIPLFGMAAILNTDIGLNIPDFRAKEKIYQELSAIRDLVTEKGTIFIQTRMPNETMFRHFRDNAFDAFAKEELSIRKAFAFPPYSRLMEINISRCHEITDTIKSIVHSENNEIEILGPTEKKAENGQAEYRYMMKHPDRKVLHQAARAIINKLSTKKGPVIRIDVDPY